MFPGLEHAEVSLRCCYRRDGTFGTGSMVPVERLFDPIASAIGITARAFRQNRGDDSQNVLT